MRTIPAGSSPVAPLPVPALPALGSAPPAVARSAGVAGRGWTAAAIMDDPATAGVLHAVWSGDAATVCRAGPGSGKSRLVVLLAATLAERAGLRVGVAAATRDQAVQIGQRLGALGHPALLAWARQQPSPVGLGVARAAVGAQVRFPASGGGVVIATTARWLVSDPHRLACDVMIVDEAWQQTYGDLCALGAFAPQYALLGDEGQIEPIVAGGTRRWQDSPTGPHLAAPDALLAAHPDAVAVVDLLHTWRLGPDTTQLVQPIFYPRLPFESRRPDEHLTSPAGTIVEEITTTLVPVTGGPGDPSLVEACADRARDLLNHHHLCTPDGDRPLTDNDVAVVTPHVGQAAAVRALLADCPGLLIGTANQLQGLERPAVVALHPLAGYRDPTGFATNPGRACVMLTRHRAHLTLVCDPATPTILAAADQHPGTVAHRAILNTLLP